MERNPTTTKKESFHNNGQDDIMTATYKGATLGTASKLTLSQQIRTIMIQFCLLSESTVHVVDALKNALEMLTLPQSPFRKVLNEMIAEQQQRIASPEEDDDTRYKEYNDESWPGEEDEPSPIVPEDYYYDEIMDEMYPEVPNQGQRGE